MFDVHFSRPNNFIQKEITFDDINNYNFTKGFTEHLINEDYVNLYFYFDSIKSEDESIDDYNWLEKVSKEFSKFSIGRFCNNKEMGKCRFRCYDECEHYLSVHAVFYETCISTYNLKKIMKHTEKKGIHKLCDLNVS